MTEKLHSLIDRDAAQPVINERIAGLLEGHNHDVASLTALIDKITGDHERRIRYLERTMAWALGGTGVIGVGITVVPTLIKLFK
jgi:hypothetical protein